MHHEQNSGYVFELFILTLPRAILLQFYVIQLNCFGGVMFSTSEPNIKV
jgi:hypothetical protein